MLSLLVHPQDHTGDRIAHIMVAALIVVVNCTPLPCPRCGRPLSAPCP